MQNFYDDYEKQKSYEIYSLATLGKSILMPFIIKAYVFKISDEDKNKLFDSLQCILIRHRIIGTKAHLEDRLGDVFKEFTEEHANIDKIIDRIEYLKSTKDGWWNYWSNESLQYSIGQGINRDLIKLILWKYENYLIQNGKKHGYGFLAYSKIDSPEIEHIAPQTQSNGEPIAAGYCAYDEDFENSYLNCIGN